MVFVVSLPSDAIFAPGRTFAIAFDHLFDVQLSGTAAGKCLMPTCAVLPQVASVEGAYLIFPSATQDVRFSLGNPGFTALPVQATYRFLWPQSVMASEVADAVGLPVDPVQAQSIEVTNINGLAYPGPAASATIAFKTFLPAGLYQRILTPIAPLDQVFPPELETVLVPGAPAENKVENFTPTSETGVGFTVPTFDITLPQTPDGWTAYLRDDHKRVISNMRPLSGGTTKGVILATCRCAPSLASSDQSCLPSPVDALTNAALVLRPPRGAPLPTAVFAPIGNVLPAVETYPRLPATVSVQGTVHTEDGTPTSAQLYFEAVSITDQNGLANTSNFEFSAQALAQLGGPPGVSQYSVDLPQGTYRLSVRPLDGESQVTVERFATTQTSPIQNDVVVADLRIVSGTCTVADGRPLSGATVQAIGIACPDGTASSGACMPRGATASTNWDGSFQLALDPGQYVLSIRPADGSRLPWVNRPLMVQPADVAQSLPVVTVPAPVAAGLRLVDPSGEPLARTLVRVFRFPAQGGAPTEIGSAMTGSNGAFEMYLAPP